MRLQRLARPPVVADPGTPTRLRVSVHIEEDGTICLKVLADDRLIVETRGQRTITIESEIAK